MDKVRKLLGRNPQPAKSERPVTRDRSPTHPFSRGEEGRLEADRRSWSIAQGSKGDDPVSCASTGPGGSESISSEGVSFDDLPVPSYPPPVAPQVTPVRPSEPPPQRSPEREIAMGMHGVCRLMREPMHDDLVNILRVVPPKLDRGTLERVFIDWRALSVEHRRHYDRYYGATRDRESRQRLTLTLMLGVMQALHEHSYKAPGEKVVKLHEADMSAAVRNTCILVPMDLDIPHEPTYPVEAPVRVIREDSIDAGLQLLAEGINRPCVMNLASARNPGGGCTWGTLAQEESLMYRSSYIRCLHAGLNAEFAGMQGKEHAVQYPWPDPCMCVYSPRVLVFRRSQREGWEWMETPAYLDFVAVAALKNPETKDNRLSDQDRAATLRRVHLAFKAAYDHQNDGIVLGALGCGAYHNPPAHIAEIMAEAVSMWRPHFKLIVFAIVAPRRPGNNHEVFEREMRQRFGS